MHSLAIENPITFISDNVGLVALEIMSRYARRSCITSGFVSIMTLLYVKKARARQFISF